MDYMFYVRSARALAPTALSRALPVHAVCVAATQCPHTSPLPASHARLSTRQKASAFNQPLSFDTSKVTDMGFMFDVRSARALAPSLEKGLHAACRRSCPPPPASRYSAPRRAPYALSSAVCNGVQPDAELRHLERHKHERHIPSALPPVPCSQAAAEPSPARCVHRCRPPSPASRSAPAPRIACALASTLGRARRRSTSR